MGRFLLPHAIHLWREQDLRQTILRNYPVQLVLSIQVTWINTCTFSLYLIPWAVRSAVNQTRRRKTRIKTPKVTGELRSANELDTDGTELIDRSTRSPLLAQEDEDDQESGQVPLLSNHSIRTFGDHDMQTTDSDLEPLTTLETAKLGCIFSLIWFAANYFGTQCNETS